MLPHLIASAAAFFLSDLVAIAEPVPWSCAIGAVNKRPFYKAWCDSSNGKKWDGKMMADV